MSTTNTNRRIKERRSAAMSAGADSSKMGKGDKRQKIGDRRQKIEDRG